MSESNLPKPDENPSNESNSESVESNDFDSDTPDELTGEGEEEASETEPPPLYLPTDVSALGQGSWLNQFEYFTHESIAEIRKVVEQGLNDVENDVLIWLAAELITLAEKHEPEALERVKARLSLRCILT